jgi:amino acid adenylation domain-containing protein
MTGMGVGAASADLFGVFDDVTTHAPAAVAVDIDGEPTSYRALRDEAHHLGRELRRAGVGPGVPVAISCGRSPALVGAVLATLSVGGVYVPVDPLYPASRRRFLIEDSGAKALIDERHVVTALTPATAREPLTGALYVIYTSGSTGRPKGVVVTHENLLSLLRSALPLLDVGADDRWLLFHSPSFDFAAWELWGALFGGATLVVPRTAPTTDLTSLLDLLVSGRVGVLNSIPSTFRYLTRAWLRAGEPQLPVRHVMFGGERLDAATVAPFLSRHSGTRMTNLYGITEATIHATHLPIRTPEDVDGRDGASRIGRALPHLEMAVVGGEGRRCAVGEAGELWIGGGGVARGYLGQPELTDDRFRPAPPWATAGGTWFRTGDVARELDDGGFAFIGRQDEQVKMRGFRIELGEVDAALRALPGVTDAITAVVRPGTDLMRLVGCVVADDAHSGPELRQRLTAALPAFMVPARIAVVREIPRTPSGKLDRAAASLLVGERHNGGGR